MLLQFTIENFLSFRDRTVLSMLADPRIAHTNAQTHRIGPHETLRTVGLYGANGSGKSNLVKAFSLVRRMVLGSTGREDERLPVAPFKLDAASNAAPTHVEVEFMLGDAHYSYGFDVTAEQIQAEWLSRVDPDGETPLFTRGSAKGSSIVLGALSEDKERREFLGHEAIGTLDNQLFLADAGRRNVPELEPFREYFRQWAIIGPQTTYEKLFTRMDHDEQFRAATASLLADAGTGIAGLRVSKSIIANPPSGMAELLKRVSGDHAAIRIDAEKRLEVLELWASHGPPQGSPTELNMRDESDGTQRLLHLAPLLHDIGQVYSLCIIDELDRSLHPLITRLFLQRFITQAQSGTGQLIFTTHDTNILDFKLLSRDAVGFVEKDVSGRSITYPLSELNQAQVDEVEAHGLEAAYLDGRFGAIPFLGIRKRD